MDAYKVLGIAKSASDADVKKAYRLLSQKWHPDRNKTPQAESKFKIIQEAYNFICTGISNTGIFLKQKPAPAPAPKEPGPAYAPEYYDSFAITKQHIVVTFNEVFNGGSVFVPNSNYIIKVPKGVYTGYNERQKAISANSTNTLLLDIEYEVKDITGFYSVRQIDGSALHLYCEYKATLTSILSEREVVVRNPDPNSPDIVFALDPTKSIIKVPHGGLPTAFGRNPLYVKILPVHKKLDNEDYGTLNALRSKLNKILDKR
jgi:hypothetical protein